MKWKHLFTWDHWVVDCILLFGNDIYVSDDGRIKIKTWIWNNEIVDVIYNESKLL